MSTIIEVRDLKKSYGPSVAVDGISFDVNEGEIFGLLGPNGAGKTTTVECLQSLRRPDSGSIRVLGLDPARQTEALKRRIGSQLQEAALPERVKVWEALDLFASVTPNALDWPTLLEQWGLKEKRNSSFSSLSGGQRQRLFVALALVNNPEVVFLDEMTTGLDPAARRVAWELIRSIRDNGATVVMVTHFMEEAEALCDRVAIIDRGQIVALETPGNLIAGHSEELKVTFTTEHTDLAFLNEISCVESVALTGRRVEVTGNGPVLALVAAALVAHDIMPLDLEIDRPTLEDIFLKLTGHGIGD